MSAAGLMFWLTRKKIRRVVFVLQGDEAVVVVAVSGLEPAVVPIVHHEIHIAAVSRVRMHGLPIALGPARDFAGLLRIGVDASDDHRPGRVARVPGSVALADTTDRAVDRIKMHERERARCIPSLRDMSVNRFVGQFIHEIAAPVPLQAFREERIEHGLEVRIGPFRPSS